MDYSCLDENLTTAQNYLIDRATGGNCDDKSEEDYARIRLIILKTAKTNSDKKISELLPSLLKKYQTLNSFWNFIKSKFAYYSERRTYIYGDFQPIKHYLEDKIILSESSLIQPNILSSQYINDMMDKMRHRLREPGNPDCDGAITLARTFVDTVEKEIYKKLSGKEANSKWDAGRLRKEITFLLNIDASQDYDKRLKKIISGLNSINDGISELRNVAGDAHTKKYSARLHHAELAVNSACTLCQFLYTYYIYQQKNSTISPAF